MEIDRIMKLVFGLMSLGLLCGSLFVDKVGILFIIGAVMLLALIQVLDAIVDRKIVVEKAKAEEIKPIAPEKAEPVPIPEAPKPEPKQVFKCKVKECGKEFDTEKKLRRHFGMAHYNLLEI